MTDRFVMVRRSAGLITVQDRGRPGWAGAGVSPAGAADRLSLESANAFAGADDEAAAIEIAMGSLILEPSSTITFAVTGATARCSIDGRPVAMGRTWLAAAGQRIEVEVIGPGCFSYLAIAGGIHLPTSLGSRSTDTLGGLGPEPLKAGDRLAIGEQVAAPRATIAPLRRSANPTVRILAGPHSTEEILTALTATTWIIGPQADRTARRLEGSAIAGGGEIPSEAVVSGVVQLPPDGRPILFLRNHPTTGGYRIVAVVVSDDLDVAAQTRPGEKLRFARSGVAGG